MVRRPRISIRTYTLFPYPTLFRSPVLPATPPSPVSAPRRPPASSVPRDTTPVAPPAPAATPPAPPGAPEEQYGQRDERLQGHIVTPAPTTERRSEEHTSELQSLMRISYAVFCSKQKITAREE